MSSILPLQSALSGALTGTISVPGDKSISHRSLMFGALAEGETVITGLLEGEDVHNTAAAMRAFGAQISKDDAGIYRCTGRGLGRLNEPDHILDMGNSGTSTRLLMGIVAGQDMAAVFTGDASLNKRPMGRVTAPLEQMGARFLSRQGTRLPLMMRGSSAPQPIRYRLPVASAQVKSAILLAGLTASGTTIVEEPELTRDHTENMLRHFGLKIESDVSGHEAVIRLNGGQSLKGCAIHVPSDPSSAAFPVVAALIREGSEITLTRVGINPRRTGLFDTLIEMGAEIEFLNRTLDAGEPAADILVRSNSALKGVTVPPGRVPSMIDEFPILAVAAACAVGSTRMTGLAELRVKESDRLQSMADGLKACGVDLEMGNDWLTIHGNGRPPRGGAAIPTYLDHRIAMSFLVLGMATAEPIAVDDAGPVNTSFPGFVNLMNGLGAAIVPVESR